MRERERKKRPYMGEINLILLLLLREPQVIGDFSNSSL